MVCKNCGAQLQNDDTFCAACGEDCQSTEKTAVKCIECGKFFDKEFGICPFCGTELIDDIVEEVDIQDTVLPLEDAEEALEEEKTEGNFVLCPNCNNKYDINVGLCTICGYSFLESNETVAEDDEASDNVSATQDSTSDKLQNTYNSAYSDTEENKPVNYKKIGIISAVVIGFIIVIALIVNANKLSGVSMNQIETDISELSVVTNGVIESEYTPFTPYAVDSVEIEKRQTNIDDKEDIVYCNVVISNEYYQTDLQIKLVYNYYDDGGWVADDHEIVSKNSIAVSGVELDLCNVAYYENVFNYINPKVDNCTISQETDIDNQIDIIYITDEENHYTVSASATFTFDQNYGWQTLNSNKSKEIVPKIYNVVFDYDSVMKGTFYYYRDSSTNVVSIVECTFKILSYDSNTNEIQGSYDWFSAFGDDYVRNKNFKAILNKENHSITFLADTGGYLVRTKNTNVTLYYDFDEDSWTNNRIELERK